VAIKWQWLLLIYVHCIADFLSLICCWVGSLLAWCWYLRLQHAVHSSSTHSQLLLSLRSAHTCRKLSYTACKMMVIITYYNLSLFPSVLWHCWLGVRKSTQPVQIEWWGVDVVVCLVRGADCLHVIQLMPLPSQNPIISCLIRIQTGFTFLVLAYPGCHGKEAVTWVLVCFCLSHAVFIRQKNVNVLYSDY